MIIDFHTHIFPPRVKENRRRYTDADPHFAELYSDEKAKIATADELVQDMDKEGIDISVVLNTGWTTHELCVETNDYILESIARYPGRLVGFCAVQPRFPDAAMKEIERCVQGGIRGVGEMRPDVQLRDLEDTGSLSPFFDLLVKHNLIYLVHSSEPVGHQYQGKGTVTPDVLYPFITAYPELTIVCAHWGGGLPFYALMPEVKQAMKNVYFDTAASPYLYEPEIYRHVSRLVGADKILFGSDYPLLKPGRLIKEIDALDMPEDDRTMILADNAAKLLGL